MAHMTSETPAPLTLHGLSVEGVNQCVHCGLCLASCPTFAELGTEMDSPRGRIFLIKSLAEGRIGLSDSTVQHLSLCLDCRACETVCPAGVPYGRLIEAAKAEIEQQRPGGPLRRAFRWVNFDLLLRHPRMLRLAGAGQPQQARMTQEEVEVHPAERAAQRTAGALLLDLRLRGLDQAAVRHAGRAHGLARAAVEAEREVLHGRVGQADPPLRERLDQEDAAARRVHLRAELRERRT